MHYNAVLMVANSKIPLLKNSFPYLEKNLGADKIIIIASNESILSIKELLGEKLNVEYIDEDILYEGMTYNTIKSLLYDICRDSKLTGWYFQQFLKMAYAYICIDDYYLAFDADTIPLHHISYFVNDKPQFIIKSEYNKPYFDTMNRLFDGRVKRMDKSESYIAENMMFQKRIMIEIIESINGNVNLKGATFFEKILRAIDKKVVMNTGYSEFETYGNYVMTYYPRTYEKIKIRSQRYGSFLFGMHPTREQLEWASKNYDTISFESHGSRWLELVTKLECVRQKYSASYLFERYYRVYCFTQRVKKKLLFDK